MNRIMATVTKKTAGKIDLRPDGWARFKSAVHAAAESGPKPRKAKKAEKISKRKR